MTPLGPPEEDGLILLGHFALDPLSLSAAIRRQPANRFPRKSEEENEGKTARCYEEAGCNAAKETGKETEQKCSGLEGHASRREPPRRRGKENQRRITPEGDSRSEGGLQPETDGIFQPAAHLTVHPEKTRLIPFRRPPSGPARKGQPPAEPPGTFDLLGFTHYWARSRKGMWVVKRKTAPSRFTRAVTKIAQWCHIHRHHPIAEQHQTLCQKLRGHFAYYGITGNSIALARFRQAVLRVWWEWLGRRRGGNRPTWAKFLQFERRWPLPPPITFHSVCRKRSEGVT